MIYRDFCGEKLSMFGFGCMRLPVLSDGKIDQKQVQQMTDYAMAHGVNYYDTAWPYHGGTSEYAIGEALKKYPRESFNIADKFPGHQHTYKEGAPVFERQLKKLGVSCIDYYLYHNVNEDSWNFYKDADDLFKYFDEQKAAGKIRHLGFSAHGSIENMKIFLDKYRDKVEFCQIQLNYLDWTLQDAKGKMELLKDAGLPVWVMEPVRGGKLADLGEENNKKLKELMPDRSITSWALRWLMQHEDIKVVLNGVSSFEQMKDNIATFDELPPVNEKENALLYEIAETLKNSLPCTKCKYCINECPMGLDIPNIIERYNEYNGTGPSINMAMFMQGLPADKRPSACIGCGACAKSCPQKIDIPAAMSGFAAVEDKLPDWDAICRQRAEEEAKNA